jgi:hypothetical protein
MTTTYEDATLFMSVLNWTTLSGLDDALAEIFRPNAGELPMDDANVRKALAFGETIGALVKHGMLNEALLRDVFWFDGIWARVSTHALAARAEENEPALYENFEALVTKGSNA